MQNSKPSVSVVMPVYNGEKYLAESLDGLLAQTFTDWELIIVDDASTDSTPAIIERYVKRDPRIRTIRNERNLNSGPSSNRGIAIARGAWISRLDADDVYHPNFLERMHERTRDLAGWDHFVSSWISIMDAEGRHVLDIRLPEASKIERMMHVENFLCHGATQFPKQLWSKVGGYPEVQVESDDLALWKKFLRAGAKLHVVPQCLLRYRIHDSNMTLGNFGGRHWDPKREHAAVKNAEWRISLFMKQGRLGEAREEMHSLLEAAGINLKRAFYYVFTYLPPKAVRFMMWELRPRLRAWARRRQEGKAA